jgi:hypothetical protein
MPPHSEMHTTLLPILRRIKRLEFPGISPEAAADVCVCVRAIKFHDMNHKPRSSKYTPIKPQLAARIGDMRDERRNYQAFVFMALSVRLPTFVLVGLRSS